MLFLNHRTFLRTIVWLSLIVSCMGADDSGDTLSNYHINYYSSDNVPPEHSHDALQNIFIPYVATTNNALLDGNMTLTSSESDAILLSNPYEGGVPEVSYSTSLSIDPTTTSASSVLNSPEESTTSRSSLIHRRVFSHLKYDRPYNRFLNYGRKIVKPGIELENEIIRSKVDTLGSILKLHVQKLRQVRE